MNPTEQAFLDAIAAEPHDAARRLVYADWLEDRGDPRGEYLRVLDGLDTETVFVPRYWELKARRNELRWNIDPTWREHFGDGDAYMPLFTKLPADRQARWRLVDRFIDYWHRPLRLSSGNTVEEIAAGEERLGIQLPEALKEWYRLAGRRTELWTTCDWSDGISKLALQSGFDAIFPGLDALILRVDNQSVVWGIRIADIELDDPPVFVMSSEGEEWTSDSESPTLSAFAILTLMIETVLDSFKVYEFVDDRAFEEVRAKFDLCDLPRRYWLFNPCEIFEGQDILCILCSNDHLLDVSTRTDAAYNQLSSDLREVLKARQATIERRKRLYG